MSEYVSRVVQLDSLTLDAEFYSLLKNQVVDLFNRFNISHWYLKYEPEVNVIIKFLIWQFSVNKRGCTIGQSLFGVKYPSHVENKLKFLFVLEAIVPYAYERLCSFYLRNASRQVKKSLQMLENGVKILEVINFCTFLLQNRYPSFTNRLARIQFIPGDSMAHPYSNYTYQVRELLWHQMADFLMLVLPLINFYRIKRYLKSWRVSKNQMKKQIGLPHAISDDDSSVRICCICNKDAIIPQKIDSCNFCYCCITANLMADPGFKSMDCLHNS